jgi:transcriptional regulator with XRE-family HTH domain
MNARLSPTHDLAAAIRAVRRDLGWSQRELAKGLEVGVQTVSRWERGMTIPPRPQSIALLRLVEHASAEAYSELDRCLSQQHDIPDAAARQALRDRAIEHARRLLDPRTRHVIAERAKKRRTPLLFRSESTFAVKLPASMRSVLPSRAPDVKKALLGVELRHNARGLHVGTMRFRVASFNLAAFAHELDLTLEQLCSLLSAPLDGKERTDE